jgi:hypothetical protein
MEPLNPTRLLFDSTSDYPEAVFEAFAPVKEIYDLLVVVTKGALADGPVSLFEIEAVLHANYIMSECMEYLYHHGIIEPSDRAADVHLNACVTAILAMKVRDKEIYETTKDECVKRCLQLLEYIVLDERLSKKETLAALSRLKAETTKRIVAVRSRHNKPFVFGKKIEKYAKRKNKKENPRDFLNRTYNLYFIRGLKPVHIKYEDEDFYNVLHVWCSRNKVDINSLFMQDGNAARDRLTDKQKILRMASEMPEPST